MQIKAKFAIPVGVGLVLLLTILGVETNGHRPNDESALLGGQGLASGQNINELDDATWFAEYESDGSNGALGLPAKVLAADKVVFAALLLIISGVLAAGVERRKSDRQEPPPNE